ncbi:MAG TPA: hypothetical protein PK854_10015 [Oscillospiraceae bacterium]|nr:hypothetical protein [Oscillospiraceae bacterium]HPS35588.1 hypothetical protein [Oscillospiraceae bacterium]
MKKFLAILTAALMVLVLLPASVFAATTVSSAAELTSALTTGGEIILGANISAGEKANGNFFTVASGKTVTLDLNGFTISGTRTGLGNTAIIENTGTLTIKDSSPAGTGKITITATQNDSWNSYTACVSNMWGTFTLESGTLQNLGGTDMAYAVDNLSNTSTTVVTHFAMTGGTLRSENYIGLRLFANSTGSDVCTATISGGTIYGYKRGIWIQQPFQGNGEAVLTITGGTIEATTQSAIMADLDGTDGVDIIISGGTLKNHSDNYATILLSLAWDRPAGGGNVQISGGQFINSGLGGNLEDDTTTGTVIQVSKGQFNTTIPEEFIAAGANAGDIVIGGGTEVTSGVDDTYTIIIPAKVDFGTLARGTGLKEESFTVSAENVVIGPTAKIDVKVTSSFTMLNGTTPLAYKLYKSGSVQVASTETFASFAAGTLAQSEAGKVTVDTANILYSGDYSGIMTFAITLG